MRYRKPRPGEAFVRLKDGTVERFEVVKISKAPARPEEPTGRPQRKAGAVPGSAAPAIRHDRNGLVRCRVCGCTAVDACQGGCCWVEVDLCSVCAAPADALADWVERSRRPCLAALLREVRRKLKAS